MGAGGCSAGWGVRSADRAGRLGPAAAAAAAVAAQASAAARSPRCPFPLPRGASQRRFRAERGARRQRTSMYDNLYLHGFEDSEAVSAAAGEGVPRGRGGRGSVRAPMGAPRNAPPLHNGKRRRRRSSSSISGSRRSGPPVPCAGHPQPWAGACRGGQRRLRLRSRSPAQPAERLAAPCAVRVCRGGSRSCCGRTAGQPRLTEPRGSGRGGQGTTGATVSASPWGSRDRLALLAGERSPRRLPAVSNSLAGEAGDIPHKMVLWRRGGPRSAVRAPEEGRWRRLSRGPFLRGWPRGQNDPGQGKPLGLPRRWTRCSILNRDLLHKALWPARKIHRP